MDVAIASIGMVSPAGMCARDHAFFVRAGVFTPAPSPFLDAEGERIDVSYCPWLGARLSWSERLAQMAMAAVEEALAGLPQNLATGAAAGAGAGAAAPGFPLLLVGPQARAGAADDELELTVERLRSRLAPPQSDIYRGAAGMFSALERAEALLREGSEAVVIAAADSFVSVEALSWAKQHPPCWWHMPEPRLSEAAAALIVTRRRGGELGAVQGAATALGASNDVNDVAVDGVAMGEVLRRLPPASVAVAFGQDAVDGLRSREWHLATARNVFRFDEAHDFVSIEREIGRVGAAAGAFNLCYGLAAARYHTIPQAQRSFFAWAISRDGTRGVALASGGKS